ncbi:MAG: DUF349 domain-containing protein [Burkholderiaceae bacterium]|nr:DUF349 domain-containing protein [Burkholderiaceae bacterium]
MTSSSSKSHDLQALDALTGGAFTAPTSSERAQRIRDWLARHPPVEQLQEVFRELSGRDKGAARPVRERLDEFKRAKGQEQLAVEWGEKARTLLGQPRLNIADALAWQRDAAKAGAPLSREPLTALRIQLTERIKGIEDLQLRVQVHREAAVLLAQRLEVLSTKPWQEAQNVASDLSADVEHWKQQVAEFAVDPNWNSLDPRFALQLEASRGQLQAVSEAFHSALTLAAVAAANPTAPLPPVPVWADELSAARGLATEPKEPSAPRTPRIDPAQRAAANQAVHTALAHLQQETAEGHGKASTSAAAALRAALKEYGRFIEPALDSQIHAALIAAGELEGWQRWGADKIREELVAKAEALLQRPEGQALGGRKMQENIRALREQWKQADQGGVPNHALWKRFDQACNEAHKVVETWLEKMRTDAQAHRATREALIKEVNAWAAAHANNADSAGLKASHRMAHQFAERWRDAGHVGEKVFAELQPLWNEALAAVRAPVETAQKASIERRRALIEEARQLGSAPALRIDAIRALQQRWQSEAQSVPLERRQEQKLWDAFRAPIDEAFNRKTAEREKAAAATSEHDRRVLEAAKALEAANAGGDAQAIRAAMTALEAALHGQAPAVAPTAPAAPAEPASAAPVADTDADASKTDTPAPADSTASAATDASAASDASVSTADTAANDTPQAQSASEENVPTESTPATATAEPAAPAAAPPPPKRVIAVRGDDRPGAKRPELASTTRGGRPDARDGRDGRNGRDSRSPRGGDRDERTSRFGDRSGGRARPGTAELREREPRPPRLGDTAFRAQREAIEHAQAALRKLQAQAHGEALAQLIAAWAQRDAGQLPSAQELGHAVNASARNRWAQTLSAAPRADTAAEASEALLRLEMAAQVPTPANELDARRALQLKLLTRRGDPSPQQTWRDDAAKVLACAHDEASAKRLQSVLKALLRQ